MPLCVWSFSVSFGMYMIISTFREFVKWSPCLYQMCKSINNDQGNILNLWSSPKRSWMCVRAHGPCNLHIHPGTNNVKNKYNFRPKLAAIQTVMDRKASNSEWVYILLCLCNAMILFALIGKFPHSVLFTLQTLKKNPNIFRIKVGFAELSMIICCTALTSKKSSKWRISYPVWTPSTQLLALSRGLILIWIESLHIKATKTVWKNLMRFWQPDNDTISTLPCNIFPTEKHLRCFGRRLCKSQLPWK